MSVDETCEREKSYHIAMVEEWWMSTSHSLANMSEKMKTLICMTFMCMIALENKTAAHTFPLSLPSFHNENSGLCQEIFLRSRYFATMVT